MLADCRIPVPSAAKERPAGRRGVRNSRCPLNGHRLLAYCPPFFFSRRGLVRQPYLMVLGFLPALAIPGERAAPSTPIVTASAPGVWQIDPAPDGERVGFAARTTLDRTSFGVTWNRAVEGGAAMPGDDVKVEINVEAVRQR